MACFRFVNGKLCNLLVPIEISLVSLMLHSSSDISPQLCQCGWRCMVCRIEE